jgi:hypothetical protein
MDRRLTDEAACAWSHPRLTHFARPTCTASEANLIAFARSYEYSHAAIAVREAKLTQELSAGGAAPAATESGDRRFFVPMQVGKATVYVEQIGPVVEIETAAEVYPVAPSLQQAFELGSDALRECVRVIGERLEQIEERRPQEVTVEFTISFEVKGKASLIPVLLTGESTSKAGLTVKAVWRNATPS